LVLAFPEAHKQNRSHSHFIAITASSSTELVNQLAAVKTTSLRAQVDVKAKPVVLRFGGQVNDFVGLSRDIYDSSTLLRSHLDVCDTVLRSMGFGGLYPEMFQTEPIVNVVKLHCLLLSLQYSCAMSWMGAKLHIDAVVGHSFGQLTAICVSGTISLQDAVKLVSGRASLMKERWGPERGSMISIEADLSTVLSYTSRLSTSDTTPNIEIACYNGPSSHVLVGTRSAIDTLQGELSKASIRHKRLRVTHGFHSVFTEPLLAPVTRLAAELTYNKPSITLQTCTDGSSLNQIGAQQIADHTRMPVYFEQAIERLAQSLGPSTWLEAGLSLLITAMACRALSPSIASSHTFQAIALGGPDATGSLADATLNLWKSGYKVHFWPHHHSQKHEYRMINLPPYQFEKSRHWLSWVDITQNFTPGDTSKPVAEKERALLTLIGFRDEDRLDAEFSVDPLSKEYEFYVRGHAVLAERLCPAPLYVELVSRAAMVLLTEPQSTEYLPSVQDSELSTPLGMNTDRAISVEMKRTYGKSAAWTFELKSEAIQGSALRRMPREGSLFIVKARGCIQNFPVMRGL